MKSTVSWVRSFVLLFFFLAGLCLLTLAQAAPTVNVGFFKLDGYHVVNDKGTPSGFGYEYLQNMATYTGWHYRYLGYNNAWEEMLPWLRDGKIDLVTGIQKTPERERQVDFSRYPLGYLASILTIRSDRTDFPIGDYARYNGLRVGMLYGSECNQSFADFARRNKFTYRSVFVRTNDELSQVLQSGQVDAVLSSNLRKSQHERVVESFDSKPFYAIVKKGNTQLLNQINDAMEQLRVYSPLLKYKLWSKYYTESSSEMLLTPAERLSFERIRSQSQPLKILVNPDRRPMSYIHAGQVQGLVAQIAQDLLSQLQLPFTFLTPKSRREYDQYLKEKKADVCFDFAMNYELAEQYGYRIAGQYLEIPTKEFRRRDNLSNETIAVINGDTEHNLPFVLSSDKRIISCRSYADCITAVINGHADTTYVNTYSADFYLRQLHTASLMAIPMLGATMPFAVAVNADLDPHLVSGFQKAVLSLSDADLFPIILQNTAENYQPILRDIIALYLPEISVCAGLILLLIAVSWATTLYILRQKERLEFLNRHDALTGLYHRTTFARRTREILTANPSLHFAFLVFDIDRFQLINTFFGCQEADRVLQHVANLVREHMKLYEKTAFGRVSGDVFGVCISYLDKALLLEQIADYQREVKSFSSEYDIVAVFGVYYIENNQEDFDHIFGKASLAVKSIKGNYVNTIAVYEPAMSERITHIQNITNQVRLALAQEQFEVFLQAKFSLLTNQFCGAEALVRWRHPTRGLVSPSEFIPIFEANGFITKLDYFVWERVCVYLRACLDAHKVVLPVSVNVSRVSLQYDGCVDLIVRLVDHYGLDHALFQVEITESAYMQRQDRMALSVKAFREHGFTVLMDDFGNGYSSLSTLKDIAVDILKIDMVFLQKTQQAIRQDNILTAVIQMAQRMQLPIIVEGVETAQQVEFLRTLGCQEIQGFFYARPVTISEYDERIQSSCSGPAATPPCAGSVGL